MKYIFSKILMIPVAAVLLGILVIGCGVQTDKQENNSIKPALSSKVESNADSGDSLAISKEVELSMHLFGQEAPGTEAVYKKLNEMMKADINATVSVSFLPDDDAYHLMLSSGEDFDLCMTTNWLNYADYSRKGAFMEINSDMIRKYAPGFLNVDNTIINSGKVDGKLYAFPEATLMYNYRVYVVRGDLMDKYKIPDIKSLDDFGDYLDAVKKNETDIIPLHMGKWDAWQLAAINFGINDLMAPGAPDSTSPIYLNKKEDTLTLYKTLENESVIDFCKKMKEWREKGYWTRDALSNPIGVEDSFLNGKSAAMTLNYSSIDSSYTQLSKDHPEWDVRYYAAFEGLVDAYSPMTGGMSIGANSKNPDRALMLLDLLTFNRKYYDLVMYGIEGTNYTLSSDGQICYVKDNSYSYGAPSITNDQFKRRFAGSNSELELKFKMEAEKNFKPNPTVDFALDTREISGICEDIANLYIQYGMPLYLGFVDDVDEAIVIYRKSLDGAGLEEYIEAARAQIQEYANNSK